VGAGTPRINLCTGTHMCSTMQLLRAPALVTHMRAKLHGIPAPAHARLSHCIAMQKGRL
jgi:hypothetical protein